MSAAVRPVDPSVSRTPIPLDAKGLSTVCVLCSHNCGLEVDVEDGRIQAVRADESNPITKGYVCNKGFSVARYAHHAQRLEHPLRCGERRCDASGLRANLVELGSRRGRVSGEDCVGAYSLKPRGKRHKRAA